MKMPLFVDPDKMPFSRGILAQSLISIGMPIKTAYTISDKIANDLETYCEKKRVRRMNKDLIMNKVMEELDSVTPVYRERYYLRYKMWDKITPIILYLSGVTGVGKSTMASLIAPHFKIWNIIGTDILREILRSTISPALVPPLHTSSYEAYKMVSYQINPIFKKPIVGFEEQSAQVIVAIDEITRNFLDVGESAIIEGVHVVPKLIDKKLLKDPHVITMFLYLKNKEIHVTRFKLRERSTIHRRHAKYLKYFDDIRAIQDYLLEQAIELNLPIVDMENDENAYYTIMNIIWDQIKKRNKEKLKNF